MVGLFRLRLRLRLRLRARYEYKVNNTFNSRANLHRPSETKETWRFLSTSAFVPSDGRSQFSLMPDHLIGISNGAMAVSRTFARWSTCTICVICVSAKRSYCPSSSRTRSHYHFHAFHSHTFQLGLEHDTQQKAKKASRSGESDGDQHGVVNNPLVIVFVTTKDIGSCLKLLILL